MDSDPLERERGITRPRTLVEYRGIKINIIDTRATPTFRGSGAGNEHGRRGLLLVDAVDGPMPQTRYVLQQALQPTYAHGGHQQDRPA